jgi:hypothetical protein
VLGLAAAWLGVGIEEVEDPATPATADAPPCTILQLAGADDERAIALPEVLFATPADAWLTSSSTPVRPLATVATPANGTRAGHPALPVLFGTGGGDERAWIERGNRLELTVDVLGGMFWLLARCEELVVTARDRHGRFPFDASLAAAEGFADRPLVDEYVALLGAALRARWPELPLVAAPAPFRLRLTHDIDTPFAAWGLPAWRTVRSMGADVTRRRDPGLAAARARAMMDARSGRFDRDPLATFALLMDVSELHGLRSQFYFQSGTDASDVDFRYRLSDRPFGPILRRVHERGHGIGLHAGYSTFDRPQLMADELAALQAACKAVGADRDSWGVRQHYLRWDWPATARIHESLGLAHDSTVGFAEEIGFRSGTGREYQLFDPVARRAMALTERPLLAMDVTLLEYQGLDRSTSAARIRALVARCRQTGGEAVLLVHNDSVAGRDRGWYRELVAGLVA